MPQLVVRLLQELPLLVITAVVTHLFMSFT
jgi:hypothetical protein